MKSVAAYLRNLLGWVDEVPAIRKFKRDRPIDDDFSSDDDFPEIKRLKQMRRTNFPDINETNDKEKKPDKNVHYVPIQIEGHPSTSTPKDTASRTNRVRTVPVKLVNLNESGRITPITKARLHSPVNSVVHAVDDDDDEEEITWVEAKPIKVTKKPQKVYIDLAEDDSENQQDDDEEDDEVIFVKKVPLKPAKKAYEYVIANGDSVRKVAPEPVFLRMKKADAGLPKTCRKFKAPVGVLKGYKLAKPAPVPKWMQAMPNSKTAMNLSLRNKYSGQNGSRSTLSDIFNLDEKRNYQELIKKVADSMKHKQQKSTGVINLSENCTGGSKLKSKYALDQLNLAEQGLEADNESDSNKCYDPITVASIHSSDSDIEIVSTESNKSSVKIDPINTLRDSYRDIAVMDKDWLVKLNSKYKQRKQVTQERLKDARKESDMISKVNSEQNIAHLEHKLKYDLIIPESLIKEPEPIVELPPLTPEQETLVSKALAPGPSTQVLIEKFGLRITKSDIQTLSGLNWLNDEVINFYMNLLMQRSEEQKDLPKVYATNTFFYPRLMQSGHAGLRRWTRKVDIFAHHLMVVPIHLGVHWCVSLIDFRAKRISYLDSMGGRNQACLDALLRYLAEEHSDKKGAPLNEKPWRTDSPRDIPQQMNGSDCGMFACTFAEFAARNAPFSFGQAQMPYLRRKAVHEIITGKLML